MWGSEENKTGQRERLRFNAVTAAAPGNPTRGPGASEWSSTETNRSLSFLQIDKPLDRGHSKEGGMSLDRWLFFGRWQSLERDLLYYCQLLTLPAAGDCAFQS